jgi:hypothetical protein
MRATLVIAALIAAAVAAGAAHPVSAHHSIAMFDGGRVVKIEGQVTAFRWINPHAIFELDGIIDGESVPAHWIVEMQAPNTMTETGWSRTTLAAGDRITVFANPARDAAPVNGAYRVLYTGIILPGGLALGHTDDNR